MTNRRKRKISAGRNKNGSGIIYGVIAVAGILLAAAFGTIVLINVGFGSIYEEKLARVNVYAAQYAAAHAQSGASESSVRTYTENLMTAMGLTPKNVSINVATTSTANGPAVQVSVTNQFDMLNTRGLLPQQITLQNTVAAVTGGSD